MNVNEIAVVTDKPEDMLIAIFEKQKALIEKYHKIEEQNGCLMTKDIPVDINDPKGQMRLKDFAWRVTEELGEAMNTLKNKPWKQTHLMTDRAHYEEEIADAFHFFVELCILSDIDAYKLYDLYFRKNAVNQWRQETNY